MKTTKSCKYNVNSVKGLPKADRESISYKHPCGRQGDHCHVLLLKLSQFR